MLQLITRQPRRMLMTLDAVGGVWRYAMDLAMALAQQGVEIIFAGFGPQPNQAQCREAQAIGVLLWSDLPLDWTSESAEDLRDVPRAIAQMARQYGVDLVHLNLPTQAAGLAVDCPVVAVSHSCVTTWFAWVRGQGLPSGWDWHFDLNRHGLMTADAIVTPSQAQADLLARCYGPIGPIAVVHNAVRDDDHQMPTQRQNAVIAAGRWWDEGKNAATLDAVAARIDLPVLAAGSCRSPQGDCFTFTHARELGELAGGQVRALLRTSQIFVSPSIYEPFGLAALEAAHAGTPMVLADIPTYRELWDGAALFALPHDPDGFAEAIARLATDARLRRRLVARARVRARGFTPERQAAAMLALYGGLMTRAQLNTHGG